MCVHPTFHLKIGQWCEKKGGGQRGRAAAFSAGLRWKAPHQPTALCLSADAATLPRGTPLYGQPSWWGDGDADDENSFKQESRSSIKKHDGSGRPKHTRRPCRRFRSDLFAELGEPNPGQCRPGLGDWELPADVGGGRLIVHKR